MSGRISALVLTSLVVVGCGDPAGSAGETGSSGSTGGGETGAPTSGGEASGSGDSGGGEDELQGSCVYVNPFSMGEECREYRGGGWSEADQAADCAAQMGTASAGACEYPATLGACVLPGEADAYLRLVFPGDDPSQCQLTQAGCELFAKGTFTPSPVCEDPNPPADPNAGVFEWPTLECVAPLQGEPPGMSEGGQVCTWSMIGGCTEEGRKFADYSSCEPVLTQRPYVAVPPYPPPAEPDTRLQDDPDYAAEQAWVTRQVESCGCVCCHQASLTPNGAGVWDIEAEGNWINTFSPYGLAFAAGLLDSSPLGAYPAAENNGFDRMTTGLPTTDIARMQAFFVNELKHRGIDTAQYADDPPTPKIFYDQEIYEPGACAAGQGVAADGTIEWTGGPARYVYVLAGDAGNPGVPPNRDLPAGTLWRLDVPSDGAAQASGSVRYGVAGKGLGQGFPQQGEAPAPLVAGDTYYLYVLADIGVPITRCLFTAK